MNCFRNLISNEQKQHINRFISKNKKSSITNKSKEVVLFEECFEYPRLIAFSYFAEFWSIRKYKLVSYNPHFRVSLSSKLRKLLTEIFLAKHPQHILLKILRSMGIRSRIKPDRIGLNHLELTQIASMRGESKEALLNFSYSGVPLGEIFYDWFLRKNLKPTVDTNSNLFLTEFENFLGNAKWWLNYFDNVNVKAVHISHHVYIQGLPARIAIFRGIPVYAVSFDRCYFLSESHQYSEMEFENYHSTNEEFFNYKISIPEVKEKLNALQKGEEFITKEHSSVSSFKSNDANWGFKDSQNQVNVLIATHCFTESVHHLGSLLFPDYYMWTLFLANLSKNTSYSWYIRAHPYFNSAEHKTFYSILKDNPHLIEVPSDISLSQLVKSGINAVFTAYGTIGFDAPSLKVLTVAASTNAAYKNYTFCKIPNDVSDLVKIVEELPDLILTHKIKEEELLHFFSVHFLRMSHSWLFGNLQELVAKSMGQYSQVFTDAKLFSFWIDSICTKDYEDKIRLNIKTFIERQAYFMDGHSIG